MAGKRLQATVPEPIVELLENLSIKKGMSKSLILTIALEEYFNKQKEERSN